MRLDDSAIYELAMFGHCFAHLFITVLTLPLAQELLLRMLALRGRALSRVYGRSYSAVR